MKYCKLSDGMYVGPLSKELRKKLPVWVEFDSEAEALMRMDVLVVGSLKRLESFRDAILTMLYRGGCEYAVGDGHCSSYADVLEFYQDCSVRDEYLEDKILSMSDEGYGHPDFDKFVAAGCGEVSSRSENEFLGRCMCRFEHLGVGRGFVGHGCGCMMGVF